MPECIVEKRNKFTKIEMNQENSLNEDKTFVEDRLWGFRITGGAEFGMPITVFHVTEGGYADQAGIKLGDTIMKINDTNTKDMSLAEAHQRIEAAENDLNLSVKNFEDEEGNKESEEQTVNLGAKKRMAEDRSTWITQPERKVWHPVVWQQPPPPVPPELHGKDAPHKRIINNIYRFFREHENNQEFKQKHIEDMLLALPSASKQNF